MNKESNVKKVIGVISGKGGVGKSSVTSMLAVATQRMGYKTAILDARYNRTVHTESFWPGTKGHGQR